MIRSVVLMLQQVQNMMTTSGNIRCTYGACTVARYSLLRRDKSQHIIKSTSLPGNYLKEIKKVEKRISPFYLALNSQNRRL
ncbi:unnamed protein product [Acanthoscelides obtectus]|uniref:Uncharacterized protein n=1 Tax=Acanthoscelides obtectus TaxID=200917 RepID=A0A9P0K170_ACAOB|nr:unnamed protein product [Acanthoscelides obtectus]CAK1669642.1 hypothetical protein AOBTE_LOCUS27123 [Acanthoscelides obtectus]